MAKFKLPYEITREQDDIKIIQNDSSALSNNSHSRSQASSV